MANSWFRLWTDMVNDPKWRTIARVSGQSVGDVIAVYVHLMTMAANATERGRAEGFNDEDVATALDINTEQVAAIREAMQGRVLDGDYLTGWERRQPLREDGAAERARAFRERKKAESELMQTQPNATERQIREEEKREEKIEPSSRAEAAPEKPARKSDATATRLPADWMPSAADIAFCQTSRPDLNPQEVSDRFRDYWIAQPGAKGRKTDWPATWRNWVRNEKTTPQARGSPDGSVLHLSKAGQATARNIDAWLEMKQREQGNG